jgi:ADP-ribosylglycohydrolase
MERLLMHEDHAERLDRSRLSLDGLSVGDAYGNHHGNNQRKRSSTAWEFSDDTLMALSIVSNLRQYGEIQQNLLARSFAERWEGQRGYGQGVTRLLKRIQRGDAWEKAAKETFEGQGSFGNGAAMRVAPVGAYFADNLMQATEQAQYSAIVTHGHSEGIAGAIAVAIASALAFEYRQAGKLPSRQEFLTRLLTYLPDTSVKDKLKKAIDLPPETSAADAATLLGNGRPSIAQQTVPFALWSAAQYLSDYELAIKRTASVKGDVDTNCAIVGGIVAMYTGRAGIPAQWLANRETLPDWPFTEQDKVDTQ